MSLKLYKAYNFRTKDPVIDELRTIVQDAYGIVGNKGMWKAMRDIEINGGPSVTAMTGWFHGKTRRPQSASVEAAGRAMGYKRVWVKNNGEGKGKTTKS